MKSLMKARWKNAVYAPRSFLLLVSHSETFCFSQRNILFPTVKRFVSHSETFSFSQENTLFHHDYTDETLCFALIVQVKHFALRIASRYVDWASLLLDRYAPI